MIRTSKKGLGCSSVVEYLLSNSHNHQKRTRKKLLETNIISLRILERKDVQWYTELIYSGLTLEKY
jgi:hypothetical protein